MKKKVLAAILVAVSITVNLAFYVPVSAQKLSHVDIERMVAEEINSGNMIQYVVDLCNGTMGPEGERLWNPRTQGTPYGEASNAYILEKFEEWGLDEIGIFENPSARDWYYLKMWNVSIEDFSFSATWPCRWSAAGDFEGELVYVGEGTSDGDYEGKDVEDKIVLADGRARSVYRLAVEKYNASGILTDSPNLEGFYTTWALCDSIPFGSEGIGITISYMDGQELKGLLDNGPVTVHIDVDAEVTYNTSKSVIGTIGGRTNSERYVLVVGHADADAGNMGADDNASGIAVLMEMARALMKLIKEGKIPRPNFSIKFMSVGTEISDTWAYIEAHEEELNNIIAVINFDECGYGGWADVLYFEGNDIPVPFKSYGWFTPKVTLQPLMNALNDIGRDYVGIYWDEYTTNPFLGGSDHQPYVQVGVPATIIWTDAWWMPEPIEQPKKWGGGEILLDACPYYHSSGDTPANTVLVEPWNMEWGARSGAIAVLRLALCRTSLHAASGGG
ncbi:MAG: M28 family peptidase [Candidatus Bathyarchaeota archaeon]|nr:M28 family peptidase [Candidatus Bathyarchaeota archaeon]